GVRGGVQDFAEARDGVDDIVAVLPVAIAVELRGREGNVCEVPEIIFRIFLLVQGTALDLVGPGAEADICERAVAEQSANGVPGLVGQARLGDGGGDDVASVAPGPRRIGPAANRQDRNPRDKAYHKNPPFWSAVA